MGNKWKKCPRCRQSMRRSGKIRAGPQGGKRQVYSCPNCGYRTIG